MQTISAVVSPANKSVAVPDPAQFLTALKNIAGLVGTSSSSSSSASNNGVFGLLNALQTISAATSPAVTTTASRGLLATTTGTATSLTATGTSVNGLLGALKTVGNLLVGSNTSTAAPSLPGLLQSGMGLITSLSKFIPVNGASVNLNLASLLSLVQYTGSFFTQLTALLPAMG
uniref:Uncharacterized protein n=1 Tax=Tetradesmus obliquus TaxID=3088 RepID=A0A383WKC7_TETOB